MHMQPSTSVSNGSFGLVPYRQDSPHGQDINQCEYCFENGLKAGQSSPKPHKGEEGFRSKWAPLMLLAVAKIGNQGNRPDLDSGRRKNRLKETPRYTSWLEPN